MKLARLALIALLCVACDDASNTSGGAGAGPTIVEQTTRLFAPATDLLLVVDNSGSMCEEQAQLATALRGLAERVVASGDDLRVAVVTTDMRDDAHKGAFQTTATAAEPTFNCRTPDGDPLIPPTSDCPPSQPAILEATDDVDAVERHLRCAVNQGTQGDGYESGLEAMRVALSCDGPNRDRFAACCTPDGFDPACTAAVDFLRPEAQLLVFVVSDEDDCSDHTLNPAASKRLICRAGLTHGGEIPDTFSDAEACDGADAEACYLAECGTLAGCDGCDGLCINGRCARDPGQCFQTRCEASRRENSSCHWYPDALVPIEDYRAFLASRKPAGLDQIEVVTLVGAELLNAAGAPIRFRPGRVREECMGDDRIDEDCCPGGLCTGQVRTTCSSPAGDAFAGTRYRALAAGISGCDPLDPTSPACPSICANDYGNAVNTLIARMEGYGASVCLDARPICEAGGEDPRPCTDLDAVDPRNLVVDVELGCADCTPPALEPDDVEFVYDLGCASGVRARFHPRLERGLDVTLRYETR